MLRKSLVALLSSTGLILTHQRRPSTSTDSTDQPQLLRAADAYALGIPLRASSSLRPSCALQMSTAAADSVEPFAIVMVRRLCVTGEWERATRYATAAIADAPSSDGAACLTARIVRLMLENDRKLAAALVALETLRRRCGPLGLSQRDVAGLLDVIDKAPEGMLSCELARRLIVDDFFVTASGADRAALLVHCAARSGGKWRALLQLFDAQGNRPVAMRRVLGCLVNGQSIEWRQALGVLARSGAAARRAEVDRRSVVLFPYWVEENGPNATALPRALTCREPLSSMPRTKADRRHRTSAENEWSFALRTAIQTGDAALLCHVGKNLPSSLRGKEQGDTSPLLAEPLTPHELTRLATLASTASRREQHNVAVAAVTILEQTRTASWVLATLKHSAAASEWRQSVAPLVALLNHGGRWGSAAALCVSLGTILSNAGDREEALCLAVSAVVEHGPLEARLDALRCCVQHNWGLKKITPETRRRLWRYCAHLPEPRVTLPAALQLLESGPLIRQAADWDNVKSAVEVVCSVQDTPQRLRLAQLLLKLLLREVPKVEPLNPALLAEVIERLCEATSLGSLGVQDIQLHYDCARSLSSLLSLYRSGRGAVHLSYLGCNRLMNVARGVGDWQLALWLGARRCAPRPEADERKEIARDRSNDAIALTGMLGTMLRVVKECALPPWRHALAVLSRLTAPPNKAFNPQHVALGIGALNRSAAGYTVRSTTALWWLARARAAASCDTPRDVFAPVYGAVVEATTSRVVKNELRRMHAGRWADALLLCGALRDVREAAESNQWLFTALAVALAKRRQLTMCVELCGGSVERAIAVAGEGGAWECAALLVSELGAIGRLRIQTLRTAIKYAHLYAPGEHGTRMALTWGPKVGMAPREIAFCEPPRIPVHMRAAVYQQQELVDEAKRSREPSDYPCFFPSRHH